jgi:hypothetical protein
MNYGATPGRVNLELGKTTGRIFVKSATLTIDCIIKIAYGMKPEFNSYPKRVADIFSLYDSGQLNLEPGFQRRSSIWSNRDRSKLIDSILRNYPLPSIFLYKRSDDGRIFYDIIDGKQRIETLLMFTGKKRGKFWAKVELPGEGLERWIDWPGLEQVEAPGPTA